jgi:hypothetical protein
LNNQSRGNSRQRDSKIALIEATERVFEFATAEGSGEKMNGFCLQRSFALALVIIAPGGMAHASKPVDPLKRALEEVLVAQEDLTFAQKRFSIMSRDMEESERCAARELLGASIDFREVVEEARIIGKLVDEMKYPEDAVSVRRTLGFVSSHLVGVGQTDTEIMDELSAKITTPEAIEMVKTMHGKMDELREIFRRFASKT